MPIVVRPAIEEKISRAGGSLQSGLIQGNLHRHLPGNTRPKIFPVRMCPSCFPPVGLPGTV